MAVASGEELDPRQREFRRMVRWSAAAHAGLLVLAIAMPMPRASFDATHVIAVEMVSLPAPARSAAPPAAPSKPAPESVPAPPPPPPPKPKQVVLPQNPQREPDKSKPEAKKPEVAPKPEQKPEPDKNLDELLADFRKQAGETTPAPAPAPTQTSEAAPTGVPTSGAGVVVSPEVLAWMRKVKAHVRQAWVVPPGFRRQSLETRVVVELDASGAVVGTPRIVERSGNPWFDEGVVRGIEKSSPLPPPPRAGEWDFVFLPEDAS